jgi:hypothetical protein
MDLKEAGWEGMDWIHLAQSKENWRAVVYTVLNFRFPQNPWNLFTN